MENCAKNATTERYTQHKNGVIDRILKSLENPEHMDMWIKTFAALARVKKLRDTKTEREKNLSLNFLVSK